MRRILFYSENFCDDKAKGGLEVATYRIAKGLKESGEWEVYHAFRRKSDGKIKSIYADVIRLRADGRNFEKELKKFIINHEIEVVVNMTRFFRHGHIFKASKNAGRDIKVIFMQHFAPGSEFKKGTFASGIHLLKLNPFNLLYWLRASVYPLLKLPRNQRLPKVYRETYRQCDRLILLSEGYKELYKKIASIKDDSKFITIPNIFDPAGGMDDSRVNNKKKSVLILSRMDEIQKRISLALKIWENIEKDPDLVDWQLDIVGTGHNVDIVRRLIRHLGLQRVVMHGWKEREPFLEEDAILMMTSEYEGLPLSVLEAQAYGCVPVAFDSYASLRDVVTPFYNGVIVENFGDIKDFSDKLKDLMYDSEYRTELSKNAINSSNKFSSEKITKQWLDILDAL